MFAFLAVLFWIYFMYLWRTWEANKREHNALTAAELEGEMGMGGDGDDGDAFADCDLMNTALLNTRRKSVSFTVARLNRDALSGDVASLTVDLSTRSVPIAGGSIGGGSAGSRSGSRTGSSCTIVGDGAALKASASPTPSAPSAVALGDWRRSSMDVPAVPRRLSLAPEDALLHHSYSLYSPSASAARARFLRRESEGSAAAVAARTDRSTQSLYRKAKRRQQQRRQSQQQEQQQQQQQQQEQSPHSATVETAI